LTSLLDQLEPVILSTLLTPFDERYGLVVPETASVALSNGAVRMQVAMLYSDLAHSTKMVETLYPDTSARIIKLFLTCASRCIIRRGGEIRSFDGDRVMGIFAGPDKESRAARCALNINYCVEQLVKPRLASRYNDYYSWPYKPAHATGIDTGEAVAVRGGVVGNNDLVWIGAAPNVAAKLSELRDEDYRSYITYSVYSRLSDDVRISNARTQMWEPCCCPQNASLGSFYRSRWWWGV
jgi:class 3 adenylate cyclase